MKKQFLFLVGIFITVLFFNSCSNDFDIAADWKEIPVVYGLLDADSNVQYIKVEKAFLDKTRSALDVAKNEIDSVYYLQKLKVRLYATNAAGAEVPSQNFICELVKGDTIGLKKEDGIFASSPNYFYRLKKKLDKQYNYNLEITKPDGSTIATAVTNVLGRASFSPQYSNKVSGFNYYIKNTINPNRISFSVAPDANAVSCDIVIRCYIDEVSINGLDTTKRIVDWNVLSGIAYSQTKPVGDQPYFSGIGFFQNMRNELQNKPTNVKRYFKRMDFIAFTGNKVFEDYREVLKAQSGFTSGNSQPIFTNIVGGGLGLFASRNTTVLKDVMLANQSLDSLKKGQYTSQFGFDN
ncbi:MAG: hypothetical protein RIQ33_2481 [Bacteroidota bacterium]|jgi:hypothetical protein